MHEAGRVGALFDFLSEERQRPFQWQKKETQSEGKCLEMVQPPRLDRTVAQLLFSTLLLRARYTTRTFEIVLQQQQWPSPSIPDEVDNSILPRK